MSGEPGATIQSTYYFILYSAGIRITPAIPPNWDWEKDGDYTARFFDEENKHFGNKLQEIKPKLDQLMTELVSNTNLPIIKFSTEGGIHQSFEFLANEWQPVEVRFSVKQKLTSEQINELKQKFKTFFEDEREA